MGEASDEPTTSGDNLLERAERAERRAELLQSSLEERDRLLSVAAHEIRTPLASLRLYLDALIKTADRGKLEPTEAAVRLRKAQRQCDRLNVLLDNMMDAARAPTRALSVVFEPVDLTAIVTATCDRLRDQFTHQGRTLEAVVPVGGPVLGEWDRARLEQVLNNLVSNVFKHAPGASAKVQVKAGDPGRALLTVSDDGPGIRPEDRRTLFERTARSIHGGTAGKTGMGVGLWIVAQIVQAFGGTIRLDAEAPRGASFVIDLPMHKAGASELAGTPAA
jgi:signal transduction histidine kinase